ncbi:MAG: gamma-glutamylcyclotransferase family protein [Verrucomicrobiota bacterium]
MSQSTHTLFVYGTLKDAEACQLLFNGNVLGEVAVLRGYSLRKTSDFLFITPQPDGVVEGRILHLTDEQILIADQWEEIPYYTRKRVEVWIADSPVPVWVYTRDGADGEASTSGEISSLARNELIEVIDSFNSQLRLNTQPYTDAYLLIPCATINRNVARRGEQTEFETNFIESIRDVSHNEFSGNFEQQIERRSYPQIEIAAFSCDDTNLLGVEKASIIVSEFNNTGFSVVHVIIPAVSVPLIYLLDQASSGRIRVRELGHDKFILIDDYLASIGMIASGTVRTALFMREHPTACDFISALLCEAESQAEITGRKLLEGIRENIAQYSSAEIFASEICVLEIPKWFDLLYENRLKSQLLTLFILEIIQLQEAALKKVSRDVYSMIASKKYESDTVAMEEIEKVTETYSAAMMLWDINNFKYRTAQGLADGFSEKFKMSLRFEDFFKFKSLIEQLTSVHSNRIHIVKGNVLNAVLLILAFIQVVPIVNNIYHLIFAGRVTLTDFLTALSSIVSCFLIWLTFRFAKRSNRAGRK